MQFYKCMYQGHVIYSTAQPTSFESVHLAEIEPLEVLVVSTTFTGTGSSTVWENITEKLNSFEDYLVCVIMSLVAGANYLSLLQRAGPMYATRIRRIMKAFTA